MFSFEWLAKWSKQKTLTKMQKKQKRPPKSSKNQMFIHFWIMFNFWWLAKQSEQKTSTEMQNNKKGPLSHQKIKCSFLDYIQLLMIGRAIWAKNVDQNAKKWKSHWKIKCSFLDYVQLLMIGQVIRAKNVDRNAKKQKRPPKSLKNQMFIFVLCSTSDDQPSDSSKKCWQNHKKMKKTS